MKTGLIAVITILFFSGCSHTIPTPVPPTPPPPIVLSGLHPIAVVYQYDPPLTGIMMCQPDATYPGIEWDCWPVPEEQQ